MYIYITGREPPLGRERWRSPSSGTTRGLPSRPVIAEPVRACGAPVPSPGRIRAIPADPDAGSQACVERVDQCPVARALPARDHAVHHVAEREARDRVGEAQGAAGPEVTEAPR